MPSCHSEGQCFKLSQALADERGRCDRLRTQVHLYRFIAIIAVIVIAALAMGCGYNPDYTTRHGINVWVKGNMAISQSEVEIMTKDFLDVTQLRQDTVYGTESIFCSGDDCIETHCRRAQTSAPIEELNGCAKYEYQTVTRLFGGCFTAQAFQHELLHMVMFDQMCVDVGGDGDTALCSNLWAEMYRRSALTLCGE